MINLISKLKYFFGVLTRRIVWFLPKNKTIVVLDEGGSEYLIPSLGREDYFVIEKRLNLYIKYLLMAIFLDKKLNIKDIRHFYYLRILNEMNPVLVITYIHNCHAYWRLDKEKAKWKFLTVKITTSVDRFAKLKLFDWRMFNDARSTGDKSQAQST